MSFLKAFLYALAFGMIAVITVAWATRDRDIAALSDRSALTANTGHALLGGVWVREQVRLGELPQIKAQGVRTIIDLRPDGEAPDQPASADVAAAAQAAGMSFAYVPTPHGEVPEKVVAQLAQVLASAERPVLLFCRSGKRAARAWAMAEASRPGGPTVTEIAAAADAAGQPVQDVMTDLQTRYGARVAPAKSD